MDSFTKVTPATRGKGCGLIRFPLGLLIMAITGFFLFTNEYDYLRESQALDEGSRVVVSADVNQLDLKNEGKLVHISGMAQPVGTVIDPVMHVSAPAINLKRHVLMYQWVEQSSTTTRDSNNDRVTETTYSYVKEWYEQPSNSATFQHAGGHVNPPMKFLSDQFTASAVTCGKYYLTKNLTDKMENFKPLPVTQENAANLSEHTGKHWVVAGDAYYLGPNPGVPTIGDYKVDYSTVPASEVSVVAKQVGEKLVTYKAQNEKLIDMLRLGDFSARQMIESKRTDNVMGTWLFRGFGFFFMFIGVFLAVDAVISVISWIPIIGNLVEVGGCLTSMAIAFVLTVLTVAAGWLFYRPLQGSLLIGITVIVLFIAGSRAKQARLKRTI